MVEGAIGACDSIGRRDSVSNAVESMPSLLEHS